MTATATKAKTLTKYRVIGGIHYERAANASELRPHDPAMFNILKAGDIILSEEDLCVKHANKFEKVKDDEAPIVVSPERQASVQAIIEAGEWEEKDRSFLETLTDDRFEKIKVISPVAAKMSTTEKPKTTSILGEDVTHVFQQAYDNGFKVFRSSLGKFQVTKANATNKPINKEPLEQDGVEKFVAMYLKEK